MGRNQSTHSLSGCGSYDEIKLPWLPVWCYIRGRDQVWSPYMTERQIEQGFRVGWWRIGVTRSYTIFTDHQNGMVSIRRGRYGL